MTVRTSVTGAIGALVAILAVSVACAAPPVAGTPVASASRAAGSAGAGFPDGYPLGSWMMTLTEDDLRAGGLTRPGELTENTGVFTMTLTGDGTWTTAQVTDAPIRWPVFRGALTATGPNTFNQVTEFPPDFAGDSVDFRWHLDGDDLVLEVLNPPDPVLPVVMETHPWEPVP
jgi:hypothetical protein